MEEKTSKTVKLVRIFKLVANDSAAVFPYLFVFYLICIFVSIFSAVWRGFFYWPAFHAGVVLFALLSLGSDKMNVLWREIAEISKRGREKGDAVAGRGSLTLRKLLESTVAIVFIPLWKRAVFWKGKMGMFDYIKLAAMLLLLTFSLFRGIYVLDFFVLLFALISVLFGLDSRISAGCALALLVLTPLLLVFNNNVFAEAAAVYAYYFLVIAVITQIGEYFRTDSDRTLR
jgi:hypothetical protein